MLARMITLTKPFDSAEPQHPLAAQLSERSNGRAKPLINLQIRRTSSGH